MTIGAFCLFLVVILVHASFTILSIYCLFVGCLFDQVGNIEILSISNAINEIYEFDVIKVFGLEFMSKLL
jgi:hypothetical protein